MANLSARKVDYDKFDKLNVQVIGISANHKFSQKTFADSLKLPYPLLSDFPDLTTIRAYGAYQIVGKEKRVFSRQGFILIDKSGIVRGQWITKANTDGSLTPDTLFPSEPILKAARELK